MSYYCDCGDKFSHSAAARGRERLPVTDRPPPLPLPHLTSPYSHIVISSNELSSGPVLMQEMCMK